jgi:hypothetical protein
LFGQLSDGKLSQLANIAFKLAAKVNPEKRRKIIIKKLKFQFKIVLLH